MTRTRLCLTSPVVIGLLLAAQAAAAQGLFVRSDTLMTVSASRPDLGASDTRSRVLFLEFVRLHSTDVGLDGLEVEVAGVAGVHAADPPLVDPATEGDRALGNLIVGRVRWRSAKGALDLSLGRQYLFVGAGRAEHLDGLAVTYRSPWNVDLSLFGGRVTPWQLDYTPDAGDPGADNEPWAWSNYAAGGRARLRLLESGVASVGFIHEGHGDDTVRQNLSFDVGWWRHRLLEAQIGGVVDTAAGAPQELWLQLTSRPLARLKLSADYTYMVPALAISKTSIFSVFTLDAYHEVSAGAYYGLTSWLTAGASAGLRVFPTEGYDTTVGYSVGGSLEASLGQVPGRSVGASAELLDSGDERLMQNRIYLRYRFAFGLYATAEADLLTLALDADRGANGSIFRQRVEDNAISLGGLGLVGYHFTKSLSAHVQGSVFSTPRAESDLRLMARLTYAGDWGFGR